MSDHHVLTDITEVLISEGYGPVTAEKIRDWLLVLRSKRIAYRLEDSAQTRLKRILIRVDMSGFALNEIRSFEREMRESKDLAAILPIRRSGIATPAVMLFLMVWFGITHWTVASIDWNRAGAVDGLKILVDFEWWRTVTALTLHADLLHLVGNVVIGGIFANWYCRLIGSGVGWFTIVLSGALGNLLNVTWMGFDHRAIGASTAVFGAVGLLAGLRGFVYRENWFRDTAVPLVFGMVILSLFGIGGERTDVGAHMAGLLAGSAIGAGLGRYVRQRGVPGTRVQVRFGIFAVATVAVAWSIVFIF